MGSGFFCFSAMALHEYLFDFLFPLLEQVFLNGSCYSYGINI